MHEESDSLFCAGCSEELIPGSGDFFEVTIEAKADPYPQTLPARDPADVTKELDRLIVSLDCIDAKEAEETVHVKRIIHLCRKCFQGWIDNPVGFVAQR